jgi:hypothetical protein
VVRLDEVRHLHQPDEVRLDEVRHYVKEQKDYFRQVEQPDVEFPFPG